MITLPGIILIDNDQKELDQIKDAFVSAGLPCLPALYKNEEGNSTGLDHIKFDNIVPRIVITDLNLIESSKLSPKDLSGPIMNLLEKIYVKGPYILHFWSKNSSIVKEVMNVIEDRIPNKKLLPLMWGVLDKSKLLNESEKLREQIIDLINGDSLFGSIFDWESRINNAAQQTINSLYELTCPPDDIKGDTYVKQHIDTLKEVLALIGNETLGKKNAKMFPSLAIDQGLLPVLNDRLHRFDEANQAWRNSIPNIGNKTKVDDNLKSQLNTFYHIEQIPDTYPIYHRGVFVEFSDEYIKSELNLKKLCCKLGVKDLNDILLSEFINEDNLEEKDKSSLLNNIRLGFIEMSAECDHAQRKTKLHRYILSALIPEPFIKYCEFNGGKSLTKHAGIYRMPAFYFNNQRTILKLSFKYQIGTKDSFQLNSQLVQHKWFGKPVLRLREQILADISFKCAQYSSRPGIISFT
ncbi:hypothetical protein ACSG7Z_003477 [Cronobacter dublinensis]